MKQAKGQHVKKPKNQSCKENPKLSCSQVTVVTTNNHKTLSMSSSNMPYKDKKAHSHAHDGDY